MLHRKGTLCVPGGRRGKGRKGTSKDGRSKKSKNCGRTPQFLPNNKTPRVRTTSDCAQDVRSENGRKGQNARKPEGRNLAPMDGRTEEMQNERLDADRFANQLTLRNRMFRNDAQDVPWERTEGAETNRSPERTTYASPVAKALGRDVTQSPSPVSGDIKCRTPSQRWIFVRDSRPHVPASRHSQNCRTPNLGQPQHVAAASVPSPRFPDLSSSLTLLHYFLAKAKNIAEKGTYLQFPFDLLAIPTTELEVKFVKRHPSLPTSKSWWRGKEGEDPDSGIFRQLWFPELSSSLALLHQTSPRLRLASRFGDPEHRRLIPALPELNPYLPSFPTIFSETRKIAGKETGINIHRLRRWIFAPNPS